jgi:DNA processing protein
MAVDVHFWRMCFSGIFVLLKYRKPNPLYEELKFALALTQIPGVGSTIGKKLIKHFGSAQAVFEADKNTFLLLEGAAKNLFEPIHAFNDFDLINRELDWIEKNEVDFYVFGDDRYPKRLKHTPDSPIALFSKGNFDLNHTKTIGIVGTRNATNYGKSFVNELVKDLVPHNPAIISGLAYGIDISAHKAALEFNLPTVAVVAHGLDRVYPSHHKGTATRLQENGAMVTEFPSNTNPDRENFPKRNRIIAGLCDAVILVESKKKGGAIITADIANSYNRDVFAVPGRVGDETSEGCNALIKNNRAALLQSVADIEYIMGWEKESKKQRPKQVEMFIDLTEDEEIILSLLREKEKLSIDQMCMDLNVSTSKIMSPLLNLELSGLVLSLPGKVYQLA